MKRTRQLLQGALRKLLQEKALDEILVQDITDTPLRSTALPFTTTTTTNSGS